MPAQVPHPGRRWARLPDQLVSLLLVLLAGAAAVVAVMALFFGGVLVRDVTTGAWDSLVRYLVLLVVLPAALVVVVACTALWQLRRRPALGRGLAAVLGGLLFCLAVPAALESGVALAAALAGLLLLLGVVTGWADDARAEYPTTST
jgi:hypothetical protein